MFNRPPRKVLGGVEARRLSAVIVSGGGKFNRSWRVKEIRRMIYGFGLLTK